MFSQQRRVDDRIRRAWRVEVQFAGVMAGFGSCYPVPIIQDAGKENVMWVLPTYNRPELCKAVMDQINDVGCSTRGILFVNGYYQYPEYKKIVLPETWRMVVSPENIGVCAAMNKVYREYPDEDFYGLICDDEYVYTRGWDERLSEAAGAWNISHGNDRWQSNGRIHGYVTVGGNLVRECGWWALPGLWHWFHDDVQELLAQTCELRRFCEDVVVEHKHHQAGKATKDGTYTMGESRKDADQQCFENWKRTEATNLMHRILEKRQVVSAPLPKTAA